MTPGGVEDSVKVVLLLAFAVAASNGNHLTFLATGDWGGQDDPPYYEPGQFASAEGMGVVGEELDVRFFVGLGDNFYSAGINGSDMSPRFTQTFESVYNASSLQIPFHPIAGNHDHKGNVSAQIEYTADSERWEYPDYWYSVQETFTGDDGEEYLFELHLIDTVLLSGLAEDHPSSKPPGVEFDDLELSTPQTALDQLSWLEEQLANSQADYLWVGGHYPIYSVCSHGSTAELIAVVLPLLNAYNVTGYMSGHDHCEMHIDDGTGVQHILTGNGDNCCYSASNMHEIPTDSLKYLVADGYNPTNELGMFASFVVGDAQTGMVVNYHGGNGTILYTTPAMYPRSRN